MNPVKTIIPPLPERMRAAVLVEPGRFELRELAVPVPGPQDVLFKQGPLDAAERTAFVFVGMAGLTAATMHAPVTALVLVFELTGHYELTLPIMLCSIAASITASLLDRDSYYSSVFRAKGEARRTRSTS